MNKLQKINNIGTILQNEDEALTDAVLNVLKSMEVKGNERRERLLHQNDRGVIAIPIIKTIEKAIYSNKKTSRLIH